MAAGLGLLSLHPEIGSSNPKYIVLLQGSTMGPSDAGFFFFFFSFGLPSFALLCTDVWEDREREREVRLTALLE